MKSSHWGERLIAVDQSVSSDPSISNRHTFSSPMLSVNDSPGFNNPSPAKSSQRGQTSSLRVPGSTGDYAPEPNRSLAQDNDLTLLSPGKLSHQRLPQLSIPGQPQSRLISDSSREDAVVIQQHQAGTSSETQTPTSLSSPIVGVVDLTKYLKTTSAEAVIHGGFSDIYRGEWEREYDSGRRAKESGRGESDLGVDDRRKVEVVQVAIKLLRVLSSKGYDEVKARKRLNREVYVWHRLEHPNIATFLGTSYHMSGRPSLVLPWFKNGSAPDYLRRNPKTDRIKLILDVAKGLEYLHTLKPAPIVHGDLKGNNILITDDGHAILTDFGLSQVIEDLVGPTGITPSQAGAGPIRWQAPELLMDETCSPKMAGDVWSFGCTAYELLTGNIPYHFRVREAMVIQDIQNGVRPPGMEEVLEHQGSGGIWDLLSDCWAVQPCDRISMTEVVARLRDMCS